MIARNATDLSLGSRQTGSHRTGSLPRPFLWCVAAILAVQPVRGLAAEVWLTPFNPLLVPIVQPGAVSDYFDLFSPSAPWPRSAAAVRVFKIASGLVLQAKDAQLTAIFDDLKRRHIDLGLEIMALTARPDCGQKIEGYARPGDITRMMERIRRLGGDLRVVAMDGPLWAGHLSTVPNACRLPMQDVMADVANTVRAIRQVFPDAAVGDIETLGRTEPADLIEQTMRWTALYQAATGVKLAFMHFDVVWGNAFDRQYRQIAPRLHQAGIKVGIIYNGDREDMTDLAWTRHAEQRFNAVEADPSLVPDQAVIQTWMIHPAHSLPETQPGTLTWLVNRYTAAQTRLVLRDGGERLEGRLTDPAGRPLPRVEVAVSAATTGQAAGVLPVHVRSGIVPPKAATAVLALRINAECQCSGPADVTIGPMTYRDQRTDQAQRLMFRPPSGAGTQASAVPGRTRAGDDAEHGALSGHRG